MSNWGERVQIAFPESLIEEANQLAAIIDPDTGGYLTFNPDNNRNGYCYASIPFKVEFEPLVRNRISEEWQYAITQLAIEKGMMPLSEEIIESLRTSMLFGEECNILDASN